MHKIAYLMASVTLTRNPLESFFGAEIKMACFNSTSVMSVSKSSNLNLLKIVARTMNISVYARLEDDESVSDQKIISWGTKVRYVASSSREAWASRADPPIYLMIISDAIILSIWGTMGYIAYLLFFKIRKSGINYKP